MHSPYKKSNKKLIVIISLAVLFIGGGIVAYAFMSNNSSPDENATDSAQQQRENEQKREIDAKEQSAEKNRESDNDNQAPAPVDPNDISMSAAISGTNVIISTQLASIPDGECSLTITQSTNTHRETVQIMFQPEFSSCAGFSVPKNKLGTGTWKIDLNVTSPRGTFDKTMNFEVN